MRIGVNAGSLEKDLLERYGEPCPEAMVESALNHAKILEDNDFREFKISVKASDRLPRRRRLSGAGRRLRLSAASGHHRSRRDDLRHGEIVHRHGHAVVVAASATPSASRCRPIRSRRSRVGFDMLKSLNLRHRGVNIISCPSCARQGFNVIETVKELEERLAHISTPMSLSIIGCVVNGPGEARETDLGFTGGGAGKGNGMIYLNGKPAYKLDNDEHPRPRRRALREEGRRDRGRPGPKRLRLNRRSSAPIVSADDSRRQTCASDRPVRGAGGPACLRRRRRGLRQAVQGTCRAGPSDWRASTPIRRRCASLRTPMR